MSFLESALRWVYPAYDRAAGRAEALAELGPPLTPEDARREIEAAAREGRPINLSAGHRYDAQLEEIRAATGEGRAIDWSIGPGDSGREAGE
jgi:hypothetical protein